jgi:hypothetical protein
MSQLEEHFGVEVSRDASDYEATRHLKQRLRNGGDRKVIEWDMIAEAIEEGEVTQDRGPKGGLTIEYTWLMTDLRVGISPKNQTVMTAYEVES